MNNKYVIIISTLIGYSLKATTPPPSELSEQAVYWFSSICSHIWTPISDFVARCTCDQFSRDSSEFRLQTQQEPMQRKEIQRYRIDLSTRNDELTEERKLIDELIDNLIKKLEKLLNDKSNHYTNPLSLCYTPVSAAEMETIIAINEFYQYQIAVDTIIDLLREYCEVTGEIEEVMKKLIEQWRNMDYDKKLIDIRSPLYKKKEVDNLARYMFGGINYTY